MAKDHAPVTAQEELVGVLRDILENSDNDTITIPKVREQLISKAGASLINSWLDEQAGTLLAHLIREQITQHRNVSRRHAKAVVYGTEVTGIPPGDESLDVFQIRYNLGNGERKYVTLGAMRKGDHLALAEDYQSRGNKALLRAELHIQLARRCGDKRTDEVFTADELVSLMGKHEYDPLVEAAKERAA